MIGPQAIESGVAAAALYRSRPTPLLPDPSGRQAHLFGFLFEAVDTLLDRRVRVKQAAQAAAGERLDDEQV